MNPQTTRNLLITVLILIAIAVGYTALSKPDERTTTERVGDAIHELPKGLDHAADELKDRETPGEKLGDGVRNLGDKIKENSQSR